jgi:hypothetical protein
MSFAGGVHPEAALALGYALFLLLSALGIEVVARFSHHRLRNSKTAGFRFDSEARAWQCPQGKFLWLYQLDQQSRLVRYRAEARHCNRCGIKHTCTDSDEGRELTHSFEDWAESEMARFHRGFSLMLIVLAGFVLAVTLTRHWHGGVEPAALGLTALLVVFACLRVAERLRARSDDFAAHAAMLPDSPAARQPFKIVRNYSARP